jgi:hypothetical protein
VDNIKMDLRNIQWDGLNLINPAEGREKWRALVNTEINFWIP